jgi:hypothetical protein
MTELEALKALFERAKQLPDADPELEEALQIVDRLIQTVEQAEDDPHRAILLTQDVLRQIGITSVTYIFADDVRFYLTQRGFESLAGKLSDEEIAHEVEGQIQEIGLPTDLENWATAVGYAARTCTGEEGGAGLAVALVGEVEGLSTSRGTQCLTARPPGWNSYVTRQGGHDHEPRTYGGR